MNRKVFLFVLIIVVALLLIALGLNIFRGKNVTLEKKEEVKVAEIGESFIVEYPTDNIEARIGDSFRINFNIKILKNTTVRFLTMIVPIGIECYVNTSILTESGVVGVEFRVNRLVENDINKVWFVVEDDFGNKKDIWITIKVLK